jgi:DNA gyrase/topoisomerase IV subunit A
LKFREGDGPLVCVRMNTGTTAALFSNTGKIYVLRALEIPSSTGFGEPVNSLFNLVDGEFVVGFIAPDPVPAVAVADKSDPDKPRMGPDSESEGLVQYSLFSSSAPETDLPTDESLTVPLPTQGVLVTRGGKGFRFDYALLREPTKRAGRRLVALTPGDEVVAIRQEDAELVAVAMDSGKILLFPVDQAPVLAGPGQGVRMATLSHGALVVGLEIVNSWHVLRIRLEAEGEQTVKVSDIQIGKRGRAGQKICSSIVEISRKLETEGNSE